MSAVCILVPVVVAGWPALSAAVVAAAAGLGYVVAEEAQQTRAESQTTTRLEMEIANSEVVTEQLGRDQQITVTRDGVTVTFSRDARGKAHFCVTGEGHTETELRALGEELSHRVVQQYVYQRLLNEFQARHFTVVEEEKDANQTIRLKVRLFE